MKLFVTDYDGTLYIDDNRIKENNIMLKKLQKDNFKIVIATGRSYPSIKNQTIIHKIPYDYLICSDGSVIYDKDGNIENLFYLDTKIIKPFQDFYKNINYEEIQHSYPEGYSNILRNDSDKLLGINICMSTINYTKEIVDSFNLMGKGYSEYNFLCYKHPNYSYLCVKPKGICKASAINCLMEKYNIEANDIYVIGDSSNDYEMIKKFNGVCMDTSFEEILKISKKTYKSVRDYIIDILKEIN